MMETEGILPEMLCNCGRCRFCETYGIKPKEVPMSIQKKLNLYKVALNVLLRDIYQRTFEDGELSDQEKELWLEGMKSSVLMTAKAEINA